MQLKRFFRQLGHDLRADNITNVGAMMAYYAILALFPMLFFVLSLAMLVIPADTVRQGVELASATLPPSVKNLLSTRVEALIDASGAGFAVLSALFALYGASRGITSLMHALNTMFEKRETRSWIRRQLIAIGMTLGVALVAVLALGLLVLGPIVARWLGFGDEFTVVWNVIRWIGAGLLVMFVWALLYKFLPNTRVPFRLFTPGAIVGVPLWLGISYLFGLYLRHFNRYETTYGALGGAIIFLTWLWLSNISLLFGAEVNDALADVRAAKDPDAAELARAEHPGAGEQRGRARSDRGGPRSTQAPA